MKQLFTLICAVVLTAASSVVFCCGYEIAPEDMDNPLNLVDTWIRSELENPVQEDIYLGSQIPIYKYTDGRLKAARYGYWPLFVKDKVEALVAYGVHAAGIGGGPEADNLDLFLKEHPDTPFCIVVSELQVFIKTKEEAREIHRLRVMSYGKPKVHLEEAVIAQAEDEKVVYSCCVKSPLSQWKEAAKKESTYSRPTAVAITLSEVERNRSTGAV